jgi:hypothetical protein
LAIGGAGGRIAGNAKGVRGGGGGRVTGDGTVVGGGDGNVAGPGV